ncbi:hypothetical protein [Chryseobacterium gambrini]|uniref:Uncharacterized protein n=1 Tax=Chryseobacterium gambrini TaxID=373672 RepID=A0A1N7QZK0_9FLAO|nr:hypothetical protein [Chryseobacterium gambrini]SIT28301.1 hypothetical protein SAMN05421785_1275 [Chryseobacterium gambrini]
MNLINFIDYLNNPENLSDLVSDFNVNNESEALITCLKDSLDVHSEVSIFGIEDTDGDLEFEKNGSRFIELFPLEMLQEMVEEYINTYRNITSSEIAQRLIDYRINDA